MPEKVEAWKTKDGRLFHNEEDALKYETNQNEITDKEELFNAKYEEIKAFIKTRPENYPFEEWEYDDVDLEDINPSFDVDGWDCENPNNPIGKCIYEWENSDEWCVYCGQPEERK